MMVFWQVMLLLYLVAGAALATCMWVTETRSPEAVPLRWRDAPLLALLTLAVVVAWPCIYMLRALLGPER